MRSRSAAPRRRASAGRASSRASSASPSTRAASSRSKTRIGSRNEPRSSASRSTSMSFLDIVRRARLYLEEQQRVSLRALRREFELDDAGLEELVDELVEVQRVAVREGTAVLVCVARTAKAEAPRAVPLPEHLADKIRHAK